MPTVTDVDDGVPPLTGYAVAITADRRREEFASMLERRGARVVHAPAMRIVPLAEDTELRAATRACLAEPLDYTVASTGIGFRGWLEAADGWGLGAQVRQRCAASRLYARGPKATGAMRAAGLPDGWSPASESSAELLAELLRQDLAGRRIVLQEHGEPMRDFADALRAAGAHVIQISVYRWAPPIDEQPLRRLVELIATGAIDAVTFTSAPAVAGLLAAAADANRQDALLAALRGPVVAACVGPVCATQLRQHDVECLVPERYRLGALVRIITERLPLERSVVVHAAGHELRLHGTAVTVDGSVVPLPPRAAALLRALAAQPGRVLSRAELLERAFPGGDEHAVETSVGRLRAALGPAGGAVQTVVKRGYRLAVAHGTSQSGTGAVSRQS
jgi:uroporphyrinogen-III synthase